MSLRFVAVSALLGSGELVAEVPVEKAQFWGQRAASGLELVSWLPVSSLHYAFINEQGVWSRGHVPLEEMEGHGRIARIADSKNAIGPRWLVVGREPALDGAASIGWPLDDSTSEARSTVTMRERLLLDGKVQARHEYERVRTVQVRRILFGFATVSVLFLLTVICYLAYGSQPIPSIEDEDGERLRSTRSFTALEPPALVGARGRSCRLGRMDRSADAPCVVIRTIRQEFRLPTSHDIDPRQSVGRVTLPAWLVIRVAKELRLIDVGSSALGFARRPVYCMNH